MAIIAVYILAIDSWIKQAGIYSLGKSSESFDLATMSFGWFLTIPVLYQWRRRCLRIGMV